MAIILEADFKTQVAAMAAALTTAWSDTVTTEVAAELKNNHQPLRNIKRLMNFNAATGVVTSNDAYITAAYAGLFPNKGTDFAVDASGLMSLTSGVVEIAAPADIVLTFNQNIGSFTELTVGGTVTTEKAISGVAIVDNVVTITVDSNYIAGDVITVSGTFFNVGLESIILADEAITNNIV